MNESDVKTMPCKWCATPTAMLGTKMCDRCWELEHRIRQDFTLAEKIMNSIRSTRKLSDLIVR